MFNTSINLLKMIEKAGFEAYIVGGFARDKYLKRDSYDVDVCTSATPKDLKQIFKTVVLPKEKYGSVSIIYKKIRFDITTFRKDIKYENNRRPIEIQYISNLKEDLLRRDFTMNTLCINSKGEFIDLLGARNDIDKHIITAVGDANTKIVEDSLRILRAIRFATILDFDLDDKLRDAIKNNGYLLENLSFYRKKEELEKIFGSINAKKGINLLIDLGLDRYLGVSNLKDVKPTTCALGVWAQLNPSSSYKFSKNELDIINLIKKFKDKKTFTARELYDNGLYVPLIVAEINNIDHNFLARTYMNLPIKNISQIDINGKEICTLLKINPSIKLKGIFKDIEDKIINGTLPNNKKDIKSYILKNYSNE
ncbi:MAG: hypothetical protein IKP79_01310 [Bacilli bacterium]|nr:hypothetical protein [Bacilli bacterium]